MDICTVFTQVTFQPILNHGTRSIRENQYPVPLTISKINRDTIFISLMITSAVHVEIKITLAENLSELTNLLSPSSERTTYIFTMDKSVSECAKNTHNKRRIIATNLRVNKKLLHLDFLPN